MNCGLTFRYYGDKALKWMANNKIIVLLGLLSFCLFVSTLSLAGQRNRAQIELDDLKASIANTPDGSGETTTESGGGENTTSDGDGDGTTTENPTTTTTNPHKTGCTIRVNGDLGQPQPVYLHNNNYLTPTSNTGVINLNTGEEVTIACTGGDNQSIVHPNIAATVATGVATCVDNTLVSGSGWLNGYSEFEAITCSSHSICEAEVTEETCYHDHYVIRVGFIVDGTFYPLYWSCFDQSRLEVIYVKYELNPPNAVHQTGVTRPNWSAGSFFPDVDVNTQYTQVKQKETITKLVGANLAEKYLTSTQFLTRGHLAAMTDFIYATGQRASFYFINAAPQWQQFNSGNWNWLEQTLRARIGEAGYNTVVYTGTHGVSQLRNPDDLLVDIYLHQDENNNSQLPVPLYFYKVVYDSSRKAGTAFVSINNPYYTEAEIQNLQFCTDQCRNNNAFSWLNWQPDRIDLGYSFCCTVEEFRKTVPHLPEFDVTDLLY